MWNQLNALALSLYTRTHIKLEDVKRAEGQTLVEYTLILALVSIGAIAALKALDLSITGELKKVEEAL
jgi:Flp pilus assembly pilin Flp